MNIRDMRVRTIRVRNRNEPRVFGRLTTSNRLSSRLQSPYVFLPRGCQYHTDDIVGGTAT